MIIFITGDNESPIWYIGTYKAYSAVRVGTQSSCISQARYALAIADRQIRALVYQYNSTSNETSEA